VSQWNDKSGRGNNATQGSATSQPTTGSTTQAGLNVISFDGTDDFMNISTAVFNNLTSGSATVFVVSKSNVLSTNIQRNSFTAQNNRIIIGQAPANPTVITCFYGAGTAARLVSTAIAFNPNIMMSSTDGITDVCTLIGNNETPLTTIKTYIGAPSALVLGAFALGNAHWFGWIGEVLVFKNILSSYYQNEIFKYLSNKWQINIF
jgi:hypothetical protein